MKTIAFSLLLVSSAAAFGQMAPPPSASEKRILREPSILGQLPPAAPPAAAPMKVMQAPMAIAQDPALAALVQKQTAAISELSNRIKVLDARLAKLEEKGK
jgi:hypothetical protein